MVSTPTVRHPGEFRWETRLLAVVTLTLTVFGIVNCYSTGAYIGKWFNEATQQVTGAIFGGVVFLVAARSDYQIWRKLARPMFYGTLALLSVIALVALVWHDRKAPAAVSAIVPLLNGARRWLKIGPVTLQVSEVARFTLIAFLAMRAMEVGKRVRDLQHGYLPLLWPIGVTTLLVYVQPNLSMAILLGAAGAMVLFTAGARIPHLLLTGLAAGMVVAAVAFGGFRSNRVDSFNEPTLECNPQDQICAGLIGVGTGGLKGVGFGEGTQKLGYLSYAYSDMILSAVAEEFGFVGLAMTVLLFTLYCWMGFRIAKTARDPFGTYLAGGLTAVVGITAFFHAAVVLKMIPATGMTLPFISAGRVSIIMYLFSAGVVVSVGRNRGRPARER